MDTPIGSMVLFGLLVASLLHAVACEGQSSRLTALSPISGNQTLISDGEQDFALGFFTPSNASSNRYLGIWYNNIVTRSVVWVANRETPLTDAVAGSATITTDGNLAVLDANGTVVWSSGLATSNATTVAVLLDTGNLVLKRAAAENGGSTADTVVWQSFDHPADTWLPNMGMWLDTKTGEAVRPVSWRSADDPSPGDYSVGIDPRMKLQLKTWWRGVEPISRNYVWTGLPITVGQQNTTGAVVVYQKEFTGERRLTFSYTLTMGSPPVRIVLSPEGTTFFMYWQPSAKYWLKLLGFPPRVCSHYNRCGCNAFCGDSVMAAPTEPDCQCLAGFIPTAPQEWERGNHSKGCTRRVPLPCDRNKEGFLRMENMKVPDDFRLVVDASEEQCIEECLRNCSCTAFTYSNVSVMMSRSRCLVWTGDLNDLTYYKPGADPGLFALGDLYIRLAASELATQHTNNASSRKRRKVFSIAVPAIVIGILLSVVLVCILLRKPRGRRETVLLDVLKVPSITGNEKCQTPLKVLDFSSLEAATSSFSLENRLGEGGFGPVYKGKLHGGQEVAIKRLSNCSAQGFQEFKNEVEVIARLQHRNLVTLLGWCVHDNEKILIYEYMPNKSLDTFLFDPIRKEELTWPRRFNIIQGIAQGLLYLHRYSRLRIIHRDMKASNILLDEEMNPKISDFGLARIIGKNQTQGNTNRVVGTFGYMSPEYAFDGLFSEKSDVFAFGVIILEIVTGKRSTGFYLFNKETLNLLGYVWEHWKEEKGLDLVDSSLRIDLSTEDVMKCIHIGLLCAQEKACDRPTIASVVSMMDNQSVALPLPNQPAFSTQRYSEDVDSHCKSSTVYSLTESTTCTMSWGEANVISF